MELAIISSGSNLGIRSDQLKIALERAGKLIGPIDLASSVYQTAAWGKTDQPDFLNQVFGIYTELNPQITMELLLKIEHSMGRKRAEKWGPRSIDLDLLYFGQSQIQSQRLTLPHPGITERRFVLIPLSETYPHFIHPVLKIDQQSLLEKCTDNGIVHLYKNIE